MKNEMLRSILAAVLGCVVAHGSGVVAAQAPAQEREANNGLATRFAIDDADPESSVPSPQDAAKHPLDMGYLVMLLTDRADAAEKHGDLATAARYYRALAKAVPDRSIAFARLCRTYEALGDRVQAIANCKLVLGRGGATVEDYAHLVRLVLASQGGLAPADLADLDASLAHLEQKLDSAKDGAQTAAGSLAGKVLAQQLRCEIGARLEDVKRLEACTKALSSLAAGSPLTLAFRFALALARHDLDEAERVVVDAKAAKLQAAAVASMQSRIATERERQPSFAGRLLGDPLWIAGAFGLGLLSVLATLLARRRPRLGLSAPRGRV